MSETVNDPGGAPEFGGATDFSQKADPKELGEEDFSDVQEPSSRICSYCKRSILRREDHAPWCANV